MVLNHKQIERYLRHLPLLGQEGQGRLLSAKVLCVGAGGLGAAVLPYLAAAGIGTIGIVDGDRVELSNLQRQVIFSEEDLGKFKAQQAAARLKSLNSEIEIKIFPQFMTEKNANDIVKDFDVVIDGSDNYRTRYLLNDMVVKLNKPLVSASIYQYQGQCGVFNYQNGPCYRCLYEEPPMEVLRPNCEVGGVLGVLPGLLGVVQATEAIKIILNQGEILSGRLFTLDALSMRTREFQFKKNPDCPCCYKKESSSHLFDQKKLLIEEISAKTLAEKITQENVFLIDVREMYEREICHIGGKHIPLDQLNTNLTDLPKNKILICYCKLGGRSRKAVQLLLEKGFKNVASLQGGILAWIQEIDSGLQKY